MRDILLPKEMCSESRDLFTFWEISDKISLTVQCKTNRKSYVADQMALLPIPLNDFEGHFCCLQPL